MDVDVVNCGDSYVKALPSYEYGAKKRRTAIKGWQCWH